MDIDPSGKLIASLGLDNTIKLIDFRKFENLGMNFNYLWDNEVFQAHTECRHITFGHDGKTVLAGSSNGGLFGWDRIDGKILFMKRKHINSITGVYHNASGYYYVADSEGTFSIWD